MKLRGLVPNFYIHVSVSDLYIPMIGPPNFGEYLFRMFGTLHLQFTLVGHFWEDRFL